jgi:hypothetical protein
MSTMLLLNVVNERCDCWMTSSGTMFIQSFMKVGQLMHMFKLKTYTDSVVIFLLSSVRKESIGNYMYNNVRELFDKSIRSG